MALFTRTKKEEFVPITQEEVDQVMGEMMQQRQQFPTSPENVSWAHLDDLFEQLRRYFLEYRGKKQEALDLYGLFKSSDFEQKKKLKPQFDKLCAERDQAKSKATGKLSYIGAAILNVEKLKQKKVGAKAREFLEIIFVKMGPELDFTQKQIKAWLPKTGWFG